MFILSLYTVDVASEQNDVSTLHYNLMISQNNTVKYTEVYFIIFLIALIIYH